MRVIAGIAKGHSIKVPSAVARPTTDRVRESLFGSLFAVLPDASVLDLFAGSGALGIEALSRGARDCTFVDESRAAIRVIEGNLRLTKLFGGRAVMSEVGRYLQTEKRQFDLIFADPPYANGLGASGTEDFENQKLENLLKPEGFFVLESEARGEVIEIDKLKIVRSRDYGKSRVTIYQRIS